MRTIWKFQLPTSSTNPIVLTMPVGAEILDVQMQAGIPTLWALVDTRIDVETRRFEIYGTGHALPDAHRRHVGTVQEGPLVWHVFEQLVGERDRTEIVGRAVLKIDVDTADLEARLARIREALT